jgi:hypothetical protein
MTIGLNKKNISLVVAILIVVNLISIYLQFTIDYIVNGDLYFFGLISNIDWLTNYWLNSDFLLILSIVSIIAFGIMLIFLFLRKTRAKELINFNSILFLAGAFISALKLFFMMRIERIVFVDLSNFGLQYDLQWTRNYYLTSRLFFGLEIVALSIAIIISSLFFFAKIAPSQRKQKLTTLLLLMSGIFITIISTLSNLPIGIALGAGLILGGLIIGYITNEELVKKKILITQQDTIYRNLQEKIAEKKIKPVYIPSELTKNSKNILLFKETKNLEDLLITYPKLKKAINVKNLISAPGKELLDLFEKELKKDFSKLDLEDLKKYLPKLIVEDLEIASNFQITNKDKSIKLEFENSIFNDLPFLKQYNEIIQSFGCPLTSAVAIAITKSTGKFILISKYENIESENRSFVNFESL